MCIDYYESDSRSVISLISDLQQIIDDNPDVDFNKIGVTLNSGEYSFRRVNLLGWQHKSMNRFCIDID